MIPKKLSDIVESDFQSLIENSVFERKSLEYKSMLPTNSDSDKKEFLADVSSFANSIGGDLIYGISSDNETGLPISIDGISVTNIDQEITRLDNSIRDGIEPRIPSCEIHPVTLAGSKFILLIRISKSWISPHRVTFKGHDKFYSRSTNGKYPLDVTELRTAFNLSESISNKISDFKTDRISRILSDDTPVPIPSKPKVVLHIYPIFSANSSQSIDISLIAQNPYKLPPLFLSTSRSRYNIDGYLTYSVMSNEGCQSYLQFFRNGIIESVDTSMLEPFSGQLVIPSTLFEKELIKSFTFYLEALEELGIHLPIFLFISLLNVRGYTMASTRRRYNVPLIDRDHLFVPEVLIDTYEFSPDKILRPCFDSIWNASGYPQSPNYDNDGNWVEVV